MKINQNKTLLSIPRCGVLLTAVLLLPAAPAFAKEAGNAAMSLEKLYAHVLALRSIHSLCDEVAPERAAVNKVVMQEFVKKQELERIEDHFLKSQEQMPLLAVIKDRGQKIGIPKMRAKFKKNPQACSALPLLLDSYVKKTGSSHLGSTFDALLPQAGATAPALKAPPAAERAPKPAGVGLSGESQRKIIDIYTTASVFREAVTQCEKVSRKTRSANDRAWKKYSKDNALPAMTGLVEGELPQNIEKLKPLIPVFSRQLLKEDPAFCRNLPGFLKNKARPFRKEHPELYREAKATYPAYFAAEETQPTPAKSDAIPLLLNDNSKIVYAETPKYHLNALTVSGYFDDAFQYLDKNTLKKNGKRIDVKGKPYHYVPPLPDGTRLEGVFKRSGGAVGVGVVAIKSKTLKLAKNGRYSTSASSGVVTRAPAGIGNSGGSSRGEGSYRIFGYTLELKPDEGDPEQIAFFPYHNRRFWPDSKKSRDHIGFLNIDGKI